jgi:transposase
VTDKEAIRIYTQDQGGIERGSAFLNDLLFLATSVFLNKPAHIVAISFGMVHCLLIYRLAEYRLHQRWLPAPRPSPTSSPAFGPVHP